MIIIILLGERTINEKLVETFVVRGLFGALFFVSTTVLVLAKLLRENYFNANDAHFEVLGCLGKRDFTNYGLKTVKGVCEENDALQCKTENKRTYKFCESKFRMVWLFSPI